LFLQLCQNGTQAAQAYDTIDLPFNIFAMHTITVNHNMKSNDRLSYGVVTPTKSITIYDIVAVDFVF